LPSVPHFSHRGRHSIDTSVTSSAKPSIAMMLLWWQEAAN
jgi:hypothetical protein